jgi:peroxidase
MHLQADGPNWKVPLGRRDGLTANQSLANTALPAPFHPLETLKKKFSDQGLDTTDLVALSGIKYVLIKTNERRQYYTIIE